MSNEMTSRDDTWSEDEKPLERLKRDLDRFLTGSSGVPFEFLVWFSEPLFDLFQADPRACLQAGHTERDIEELSLQLATLEAGRLILAYLLLSQEESVLYLQHLERRMLGREAGESERTDFMTLLNMMEDRLEQFDHRYHSTVAKTRDTLPAFSELLETYAPEQMADDASFGGERYGKDDLELPDAMALFARPLLEGDKVQSDPDLLDERLALAGACWELAQVDPEDYEETLNLLVRSFAKGRAEQETLRREAEKMVQRFYQLFPERKRE